jgi:hypothetical protein
MEEKITYIVGKINPNSNQIIGINENIQIILRKLGARVINNTYTLLEGSPREAYGYYLIPRFGIVTTFFSLNKSEYKFSFNFLGFDSQTKSYNLLRGYIEEALKKADF